MQQVDDPPSLPVGTEVSAKYKGAFCEAKVRKVVRNIKVKVVYKQPGLGSAIVPDDAIKTGILRVGATVEVKHPERRDLIEATITKIQDGSQYTVVFDDGDITTLRRSALCLKSGRHFNESETLDQLPLTHPEHFSNPVIGGRRGRRSRHLNDETSDEEEEPVKKGKQVVNEKEENIGRVVCVETTDAKKKDKYFPGLVVAPTAQATVKIRVKDEYLVRSFKDGRYYTVPKKEAINFTRELANKMDGPAVQAALNFLESNELPPHWDRDSLFGLSNSSSDYEGEVDSDSSDDEPTEEKDHFVAQLYKYMDDRGTPLNKVPSIQNRDVDLYRLFRTVQKLGGYNRVTSQNQWKYITNRLGFTPVTVSVTNLVKQAYKKFLQPYEEFHRKLGCSMIMTSRASTSRSKGRSLVRANSVASPRPDTKTLEKTAAVAAAANAAVNASNAHNSQASSNQSATAENETKTKVKVEKVEPEESENTSESSVEVPVKNVKRKTSTGSNKVKNLIEKFEEKEKEESECKVEVKKEIKKEKERISPAKEASSSTGPSNKPRERGRPGKAHHDKIKVSKKKENDNPPAAEKLIEKGRETTTALNVDFPVEVGDKLKVYYHEKRVTYEAKVIEISVQQGTPLYMVHYTGWNNRYDEWIPKERIAENLTNSKAKKSKISQGTQPAKNIPENSKTSASVADKEKEKTTIPSQSPSTQVIKTVSGSKRGRGRSDSQPPRSTTPSSIASNSSRTKSPATPATQRRNTRTQPSANIRRISNNISDISMQTDSDSDSDTPVLKNKSKTSQNISLSGSSTSSVVGINSQASLKSTPSVISKNTSIPVSQASTIMSPALSSSNQSETSTTKSCVKVADDKDDDESTKGRDYDLNQIRSELKGFKELKSPSPDSDDKKDEKIFEFANVKTEKPDEEKTTSGSQLTLKLPKVESKSSTDFSSECESFGDDDSQSSDKTTQLENMTEKLQQKIHAEKLAQAQASVKTTDKFGPPVGKSAPPEKVTPMASGIEKIIKDSLAEKRQETMKASKPFIIEKTIFKSTNTQIHLSGSNEKSDKSFTSTQQQPQQLQHHQKSNVVPVTKPAESLVPRMQTQRQSSGERKTPQLPSPTPEIKKPILGAQQDIKTVSGGSAVIRPEKKPILTAKANATMAAAAAAAASVQINDSSANPIIKKESFITPSLTHKSDAKQIADVKGLSVQFQHKANISGTSSGSTPEKSTISLIAKSTLSNKEILKSPNSRGLQSSSLSGSGILSESNTSDIYEFKEPEPFEFEARKAGSTVHTLTQSFEIEKKKKPIIGPKVFEVMDGNKSSTQTSAIGNLTSQITITATPSKKTKKSPSKDPESNKTPSKKSKLDEKSSISDIQLPPISILSIQPKTTIATEQQNTSSVFSFTSQTSSVSNSNLSNKSDSTFDVLRKSPSFNLNINALNEELATAVQETTKVLTDVTVPNTPIPITSANSMSLSTVHKPFASTFIEAPKSIQAPISKSLVTTTSAIKNLSQSSSKLITSSLSVFSSLNQKPITTFPIKTITNVPVSPNITKSVLTTASKILTPASLTAIKPGQFTGKTTASAISVISPIITASKMSTGGGLEINLPSINPPTVTTIQPSALTPSVITLPPPELLNVFELKQDNDSSSKSGSDDDHDKTKKTNELETVKKILSDPATLEPPKIEKSSIADKVLKALNQQKEQEELKLKSENEVVPSSVCDVKPPIISLTKPFMTKTEAGNIVTLTSTLKSPISFGNVSPASSSSLSGNIATTSRMYSSSPISEPPKIEMPLLIKKEFENALKKPILNSPEHMNILESIAPKNNDLSETIQKLESAIKTTSNVDHFDADSSDSTDSERRLVIHDDESSDNMANDTLSAPEYSPLKKQEIVSSSPLKTLSQASMLLPQTSIILKTSKSSMDKNGASISSTASLLDSNNTLTVKKQQTPEQSIFSLTSSNTTTVTAIGPHGNATSVFGLQSTLFTNPSLLADSGVKPICDLPPNFNKQDFPPSLSVTALKRADLIAPNSELSVTTLKKEEIHNQSSHQDSQQQFQQQQQQLNIASDSINLLLCEETIPGSPTPVPTKEMLLEQNMKITTVHPTESDIKPIPMDIDTNLNIQHSKTNQLENNNASIHDNRNICKPNIQSISQPCAGPSGSGSNNKNLTKIEQTQQQQQQTPSSSPHDSQSQDDSSEDLKKQIGHDIEDQISPKKRRRTRTHSEAQHHQGKRRRSNRVEAKKQNPTKNAYCSDSDENSDTTTAHKSSSRPIRPCPYNFLVQLDPNLNPNQRISILRKKIADLRKTYHMIKAELASIDRRRKKLRRREREKKQQQKQQQQQHQQQFQSHQQQQYV